VRACCLHVFAPPPLRFASILLIGAVPLLACCRQGCAKVAAVNKAKLKKVSLVKLACCFEVGAAGQAWRQLVTHSWSTGSNALVCVDKRCSWLLASSAHAPSGLLQQYRIMLDGQEASKERWLQSPIGRDSPRPSVLPAGRVEPRSTPLSHIKSRPFTHAIKPHHTLHTARTTSWFCPSRHDFGRPKVGAEGGDE